MCYLGKISKRVSFARILNYIRDNVQNVFHVTTKRDLLNIQQDFIIEGRSHSFNYVSVCFWCFWIQQMNRLLDEENPALYYELDDTIIYLFLINFKRK